MALCALVLTTLLGAFGGRVQRRCTTAPRLAGGYHWILETRYSKAEKAQPTPALVGPEVPKRILAADVHDSDYPDRSSFSPG
jgi:hypothetical protein